LSRAVKSPDIRSINSFFGSLGQFSPEYGHVWVVEPGRDFLKAVKMEKKKRIAVHSDHLPFSGDFIVAEVPRPKTDPLALYSDNTIKASGPGIKIFLVGVPSLLLTIVTPFDTLLAPGLQAG